MTLTRNPPLPATLTLATAVERATPVIVPGFFGRAAVVASDILTAAGVVLCIPFVILAVGIPVALSMRFLLWIAGML